MKSQNKEQDILRFEHTTQEWNKRAKKNQENSNKFNPKKTHQIFKKKRQVKNRYFLHFETRKKTVKQH